MLNELAGGDTRFSILQNGHHVGTLLFREDEHFFHGRNRDHGRATSLLIFRRSHVLSITYSLFADTRPLWRYRTTALWHDDATALSLFAATVEETAKIARGDNSRDVELATV